MWWSLRQYTPWVRKNKVKEIDIMKNMYKELVVQVVSIENKDIITESTSEIQPSSGEHVFGDVWD